ncbi:winged helix-turn-helix domain-containing protein [Pseudoalteromonas piscicida]|uniref:TolB protein n=1 Tax=Pseudoalteromonas piscicida TaxID=43662 RepID=A0A2A5JLB2_PSEO7|nr:winged helix-turn-helix domain-containing protein [Pseudoalteromonas piscicida]PCK30220.1 TolB protein [Pseudoalteromonas piscicida]
MERFQIGKFDVDLSRCRISSGEYEAILEPKVMDVLHYLFLHKGEVVSQEQIFSSVWPASTFNPSSVQRCIALLRKALNEDSKSAKFLVTHPKRGYCLQLPDDVMERRSIIPYFCALIAVVTLGVWLWFSSQSIKTDFSKLLPVTSNEANETFLALSPNGKYLAFVRGDERNNNIWLRTLESGQEAKLTSRSSDYYSLGWNPEGTAIAYMENNNDQRSMSYMSLDSITMAPIRTAKLGLFSNFHVSRGKLQWHSSNKIYFIEINQDNNDTWLSSIDLKSGERQQLLNAQGQDWMKALALSPEETQMALGYEMGLNRYRVDLLNIETLSVSKLVEIEDSIQGLSWHPNGEAVLISNRTKLQLVDIQGSLSVIDFNNYKFIRDAQFNPTGSEIFMELLNVDVDILRKTKTAQKEFETLVDTSSLDFLPVFSPDDKRFVFESHRAGLKQLYVYEDGQQRMIFSNPNNEELFGVVWTPDGTGVITASKDKLFKVNVKSGTFEAYPHRYQPFGLRQHFHHDNAVLVSYRADDGVTFHLAKLDLDTLNLKTYETEGERLVCYSMALDSTDQIYFANSNAVFRINSDSQQEHIWSATDEYISGVRVTDNTLSLRLDKDNDFKLVTINMLNGFTEVIHQGSENGDMLINTSHDEQQFLYLSKPKRTSDLVRLQ